MVKKFKTFGPQLVFAEQTAGSVVVLTNEQKLSLYKKSQKSGISTDILEEVYRRGYSIWNESFGQTAEQFAFDRVNSFIAGGFAANLDEDLMINEGKKFIIYKRTDAASGGHQVPNLTFDKKDDAHAHIEKLAPGDYEVRKGWAGGTKTSRAELAKKIGMNEGKWPYSKDIKGSPTNDDHYLGTTDRKRAARKEIRKAIKAKAHQALMKGGKVQEETKEPTGDLKDACWKGYTAVGMKMKNGRKVPNCVPVKEDVKIHTGKHFKTAETVENQSKNPNDPDSRFDGTKSAKNVYQKSTPGQPVTEAEIKGDSVGALASRGKILDDLIAKTQEERDRPKTSSSQASERRQFSGAGEIKSITDPSSGAKVSTTIPNQATRKQPDKPIMTNTLTTIKRVVKESSVCENCDCGLQEEILNERGADSKGYFRSTEAGAGLTAKGAKHFGVQTAVTEKNPTGRRAARRRSFCARMSGMKGPMKDEKGRPTRKAMSLRRWRC